MVKHYQSFFIIFSQVIFACSSVLVAADDFHTSLTHVQTSLTSLRQKLQTLKKGLDSIQETLNQNKESNFFAKNITKLLKIKLNNATITSVPGFFDDTTGEFTQTITYQLTADTSVTLEFKHNRDTKQGELIIQCFGPNEYARWEKITDYAELMAELMDAGGGIKHANNNGVVFSWQIQEKQWYSSHINVLVEVAILIAQSTGGLTKEIIDKKGEKRNFIGNVILNSKKAFDLLKKTLTLTDKLENFKDSIFYNSLHKERPNYLFLNSLDLIKNQDEGDGDWQKVFEIIKEFFNNKDFAFKTDRFYFKACHTSSSIDLAQTPDEVAILDYESLTEQKLEMYDKEIAQDFVKKKLNISSFQGALIQNILHKIVKYKLYEKFSQATWKRLLELIEEHADFFAGSGSWDNGVLSASAELKVLLRAAGSNIMLKDQVKSIIDIINCYSKVSDSALIKLNATNLSGLYVLLNLGVVPGAQALMEQFFVTYAHHLITQQPTLDAFKKIYQIVKPVQLPALLIQFFYNLCPFTTQQKEQFFNHRYQRDPRYTRDIDQYLEALNYLREQGHDFHALDAVLAFRLATQNFSWVAPQLLAGMQQPASTRDIKMLEWLGIGLIVSLNTDLKEKSWWPNQTSVVDKYIGIRSGDTPKPQQIKDFLEELDQTHKNKKRAVIHCQYGQSRTGTMLAIWLIERYRMSPRQSIEYLRTIRDPSIDPNQEKFVEKYKPSNEVSNSSV